MKRNIIDTQSTQKKQNKTLVASTVHAPMISKLERILPDEMFHEKIFSFLLHYEPNIQNNEVKSIMLFYLQWSDDLHNVELLNKGFRHRILLLKKQMWKNIDEDMHKLMMKLFEVYKTVDDFITIKIDPSSITMHQKYRIYESSMHRLIEDNTDTYSPNRLNDLSQVRRNIHRTSKQMVFSFSLMLVAKQQILGQSTTNNINNRIDQLMYDMHIKASNTKVVRNNKNKIIEMAKHLSEHTRFSHIFPDDDVLTSFNREGLAKYFREDCKVFAQISDIEVATKVSMAFEKFQKEYDLYALHQRVQKLVTEIRADIDNVLRDDLKRAVFQLGHKVTMAYIAEEKFEGKVYKQMIQDLQMETSSLYLLRDAMVSFSMLKCIQSNGIDMLNEARLRFFEGHRDGNYSIDYIKELQEVVGDAFDDDIDSDDYFSNLEKPSLEEFKRVFKKIEDEIKFKKDLVCVIDGYIV